MKAIKETSFQFPGQTKFYKGKVRDVYTIGNDLMVMIVSDRISAFDHVLPEGIPFKGQILNQIAYQFLNDTKDIVPNWTLAQPDENVTVGKMCEPYKIEMVIRGYLAGHAWREYQSGKRIICGVEMPEGMKQNDKFPKPIITPATKAEEGHDEDISRDEIIDLGIVDQKEYDQLEEYTYKLFDRGTEIAKKNGLILVDTKYEFGKDKNGVITLIDEIHTPDSSRYFYLDQYEELQEAGLPQKQLSKEFVREWLMENGFQGKEGQVMPDMPEGVVQSIADRYIELYETIMDKKFERRSSDSEILEVIESRIQSYLEELKVS